MPIVFFIDYLINFVESWHEPSNLLFFGEYTNNMKEKKKKVSIVIPLLLFMHNIKQSGDVLMMSLTMFIYFFIKAAVCYWNVYFEYNTIETGFLKLFIVSWIENNVKWEEW